MAEKAYMGRGAEYMTRLSLTETPAPWEDGLRTNGTEGSYEWWYFDAEHTEDIKATVIFYTKDTFDDKGPCCPTVTIDLNLPDGRHVKDRRTEGKGHLIHASTDTCDLSIAGCWARRLPDGRYQIHYENPETGIYYDNCLTPRLPMWRPGSGRIYFGNRQEYFFAWFVGVPSADLEATLTLDGTTYSLGGNGYHDHNWGNILMTKLMDHWYWCRAAIGEYTAITCDIIAGKKYGYTRFPIFFLAKNGEILTEDESRTKVERLDTFCHPITKKSVDNHLRFTQQQGDTTYLVEYFRQQDIAAGSQLDTLGLPKPLQALCKAVGINPTYCRFAGDVRLTIRRPGQPDEVVEQSGIWEQMGFGSAKNAPVGPYASQNR